MLPDRASLNDERARDLSVHLFHFTGKAKVRVEIRALPQAAAAEAALVHPLALTS
jgi:hypothetical protein